MKRSIVVAITGASGAAYATRLLETLLATGCDVHLCISDVARIVLKQELDLDVDLDHFDPSQLKLAAGDCPNFRGHRGEAVVGENGTVPLGAADAVAPGGRLFYHPFRDFSAPIASGSFPTDGMVVCPCSGGTLGAIAHGACDNLIHRAAEVHLKERRKLILVPRETPLSLVHLRNMQQAAESGAVVLPASPGFYHGVNLVADLVDFIVSRICDQLGIANALVQRWGEGKGLETRG